MTSWKDWKYCSCIRPCFVYCLKPCFSSLGDEYGFKDCKHLDFSHCNLKEVPDEIFSLERTLEELLLDVNSIRDLPRVVFHCTGLKKLSLSDNEIETLPNAISSLVYLEYLNLSRNSLLVIPDGIKCCKCLIVLDCSVNPLGKVPDSLTQLINLQELYLNDTFLEYLPANFGRLSKLRIVELRENNLKILPKSFQRLINLERLDIGQNELVEFPEVLCNLINLQELWIDGNRISSLPEIIGNLTKLTYLDASENRIVTVASRIAACQRLTDLLLSGNKIVELPETLGSLKYLTYLRLDDNKLTCLPQSIGGFSSLQEFVMSNNVIQSIPKNIGFLRNLHSLIMDCNLIKELPDTICSCSKLRLLSVASNELSELPEDIGRLVNLRVLNLRNNHLKYLPYSFANITNLQTLWLSDNQQKPIMKLQTDTDETTNKKVLTCFLLPQQSSINFDEAYVSDHDDPSSSSKSDVKSGSTSESRIKFYSINGEIDEKDEQFISKLVRNPTPYPKELKAHARHARNLALKRRDSFGAEVDDDNTIRPRDATSMYQPTTANLLANQGVDHKTSHTEIKEAKLTLASKSERDPSSTYTVETDYDNQLPHHSLINQEEQQLRAIILQQHQFHQQSNSPLTVDDRELPSSTIKQIVPSTRINNSANPITSHSNVESKLNLHKQFPLTSLDGGYSIDHQHRPMTIYNNKPIENLLFLSSSSSPSPSLNYQGSRENSPRSNHPSPSSSSSPYTTHHQSQPQGSLERRALIRTTVTYSAHREQPVMTTQYAPRPPPPYLDGSSSSHNPLIGFNDSNRSSIKNLQGNLNVSGNNDNYGSHHLSNYMGTSNRNTIRNQQQQFTVNQINQTKNCPDESKHINHQYYPPSTSHQQQIVQQQQQSIRKLLSNDANSNNQLTKIMMTPSTIKNMKTTESSSSTPSPLSANENDKLIGKTITTQSTSSSSASRFNINTPSQVIYKQFPVTPTTNQLLTDYEVHYKNQQQPPVTINSSTQLNQLDHQHYNQHNLLSKRDQNQSLLTKSSQPTDNLLTTTTNNPSGS